MNIIFGLILILSTVILIFTSPDALLSAMLAGGDKALSLTLKMVVIYAVWLGVFGLLEKSGLANKLARLLRPLNKFLFGEVPEKANDFMSLNISANILGMSGATTPMGIKSIQEKLGIDVLLEINPLIRRDDILFHKSDLRYVR